MKLTNTVTNQNRMNTLDQARGSLIDLLKDSDYSVIEEAFILETVNRLRDIRNSIRLGEE